MALSTRSTVGLVLATLCAGTVSTVLTKLLYQTTDKGDSNCWGDHKVQKPYWSTLCMFIGEALCLVIHKVRLYLDKKNFEQVPSDKFEEPLLEDGSSKSMALNGTIVKTRPPLYYFAIFCTFDMSATVISGVGLLWVDARCPASIQSLISLIAASIRFSAAAQSSSPLS